MKKYKLIQIYPGSSKLGTIKRIKENHELYFHYINYPEFWQEVVEKDYEILKIRVISENYGILKKETICNFKINEKGVSSWEIKNGIYDSFNCESKCFYEWFEIYQIKRLSDDEIFTIGDDILEQREHSKIEYFEIRGNDLVLRINHQITKGSSTILISSNFNKLKQPLFKTEDGIDIFEGDVFVTITKNLNINSVKRFTGGYITIPSKSELSFSTKEKAEEYIIMNKPCLSLKEVLDNYNTKPGYHTSCSLDNELINLVKIKLKK